MKLSLIKKNIPPVSSVRFKNKAPIETAAQKVLDKCKAEEARCVAQACPGQGRSSQPCSLAVLYAAGNMPQGLAKAHAAKAC